MPNSHQIARKEESGPFDDHSVMFIPCEVLTRIFAFLSLSDRKNVRLTCKFWCECATSLLFTKKEKFVIYGPGFSVEEIAKVLLNPNFLQMTIEFLGFDIDSFPTCFWKSCGPRIHSLEFHDCVWSDKTIKDIILHCVDLVTFKIETMNIGPPARQSCSPELLNDLIEKDIRRPNLRTFTLFINNQDENLLESVLSKLFLIYPGIKHFNTGTFLFEYVPSYWQRKHGGKEPVYSRFDKCMNGCIKLDSLTFNIPSDGRWMKMFITESESDQVVQKLTKFESMIIYKPLTKKLLLDFFGVQNNLQVVRLAVAECPNEFCKELLFHVLENCPKLLVFHYKFQPNILSLELAELPRFFTSISKLECLSLSLCIKFRATPSVESLPLLALTALRLKYFEMDEDSCIGFLKQCPWLKHLKLVALARISDTVLQRIFEYCPNLETLVLNPIDACTDRGFIGQDNGFSIKRLQKLKYLVLNSYCNVELSDKFVQELQFPHLETLQIGIGLYKSLSEETLRRLATNLPALKSLAINEIEDKNAARKLAEFCQNFKCLHRLYCLESFLADEGLITNIFETCPSLRYISDLKFMYSFNPFTKKVQYKSSRKHCIQRRYYRSAIFLELS